MNEQALFSPIYLASASPRRHELLTQMGIPHEVLRIPSPPGEDEPRLAGETPVDYVRRTAREKAERAVAWVRSQGLKDLPILCADTTVALDGDVLGKPADLADAAAMLRRLSGRAHHVYSALVLADAQGMREALSSTEVSFKTLSEEEIAWYCASREPLGKAGAYGIQGKAALFVAHLSGSHSGVVGLPLYETYQLLTLPAGR
ncbi:Maf family protein [Paracandidimonas soli]|uniref:Maf family protein n=1 Tax=Paracandidimonas soli TaxID=1917182 RepID=UPI00333E3AB6